VTSSDAEPNQTDSGYRDGVVPVRTRKPRERNMPAIPPENYAIIIIVAMTRLCALNANEIYTATVTAGLKCPPLIGANK